MDARSRVAPSGDYEREEEKILRDELREKRKSNNGRWVIRNKKVVEVSEDRPSALKDN